MLVLTASTQVSQKWFNSSKVKQTIDINVFSLLRNVKWYEILRKQKNM